MPSKTCLMISSRPGERHDALQLGSMNRRKRRLFKSSSTLSYGNDATTKRSTYLRSQKPAWVISTSRVSDSPDVYRPHYACQGPLCGRSFWSLLGLLRHIRDGHDGHPRQLICLVNDCPLGGPYRFSTKQEMAEHVRQEHGIDIPTCPPEYFDDDEDTEALARYYEEWKDVGKAVYELYQRTHVHAESRSGHGGRYRPPGYEDVLFARPEDAGTNLWSPFDQLPEVDIHYDASCSEDQDVTTSHELDEEDREHECTASLLPCQSNEARCPSSHKNQCELPVQSGYTTSYDPGTAVAESNSLLSLIPRQGMMLSQRLFTHRVNVPGAPSDPAIKSRQIARAAASLLVCPQTRAILASNGPEHAKAVDHITRSGPTLERDRAEGFRMHPTCHIEYGRTTCPVMEETTRTASANIDAVDLANQTLDLEKRLQQLLLLTKPITPSTSEDSGGEEATSPSHVDSLSGSSGIRQCVSSGEGSSNSSSQPAFAPSGTGRRSGQHNGHPCNHRNGGDDGDEGEDGHAQAIRARSSISQSPKSHRYPCVYRVGEPQIYASHTTRWKYVSQVLRHLESHNFFMCSRCLTTFNTKEEKTMHDKMRACVKVCTSRACKRHTMDFEGSSTPCKCLLSSDDLWAATFRQAFPHLPLPAPWSSKVQPWLLDAGGTGLQQNVWVHDGAQWQQQSRFALPSDGMPQQDWLNPHDVGDFHDEPGEQPVLQLEMGKTTANIDTSFGNAYSQDDGSFHSYPSTGLETDSGQSVTLADIQRLRQQFAILEQRVKSPRRSEQKEGAMLRLAWQRLIEIGDKSVQQGGLLREIATYLTPDLIIEREPEDDPPQVSQAMDTLNTMDWDAAGLGPHNPPAAGKGKQRAVSGVADSAYYSGMDMY